MKFSKGFPKILFFVLLTFISIPVFINLIIKPGELPSYDHIESVLSYTAEDLLEEYDTLYSLASDFMTLYDESGFGDLLHDNSSSESTLDPGYLERQYRNATLRPYHPVTNPNGYKNDLERIGNLLSYLSYLWESDSLDPMINVADYFPDFIIIFFKFIIQFLYTVVSTFFTIFSIPYRITNF